MILIFQGKLQEFGPHPRGVALVTPGQRICYQSALPLGTLDCGEPVNSVFAPAPRLSHLKVNTAASPHCWIHKTPIHLLPTFAAQCRGMGLQDARCRDGSCWHRPEGWPRQQEAAQGRCQRCQCHGGLCLPSGPALGTPQDAHACGGGSLSAISGVPGPQPAGGAGARTHLPLWGCAELLSREVHKTHSPQSCLPGLHKGGPAPLLPRLAWRVQRWWQGLCSYGKGQLRNSSPI